MRKTDFKKILFKWDKEQNTRQMPWKACTDPYKVWLSEIILQQTRVEQGRSYYERFIQHFPTISDLAKASPQKVLRLWEGLGYYARCRNMHETAKQVATTYKGTFPKTYEGLLALKGIGPYTAAAIASFCYGLPYPVIDGNVYRILARIFKIALPIDFTEGKKYVAQLADTLLDKENPGAYNQAIMDFGATVCKPAQPLCDTCYFRKHCLAFQEGQVMAYPVKNKSLIKKDRWFTWFVFSKEGTVFIRERVQQDIWQNLFEFYLVETPGPPKWNKQKVQDLLTGKITMKEKLVTISTLKKQVLSHQAIHAIFIEVPVTGKVAARFLGGGVWVEKKKLSAYAFPKMIREYLRNQ